MAVSLFLNFILKGTQYIKVYKGVCFQTPERVPSHKPCVTGKGLDSLIPTTQLGNCGHGRVSDCPEVTKPGASPARAGTQASLPISFSPGSCLRTTNCGDWVFHPRVCCLCWLQRDSSYLCQIKTRCERSLVLRYLRPRARVAVLRQTELLLECGERWEPERESVGISARCLGLRGTRVEWRGGHQRWSLWPLSFLGAPSPLCLLLHKHPLIDCSPGPILPSR